MQISNIELLSFQIIYIICHFNKTLLNDNNIINNYSNILYNTDYSIEVSYINKPIQSLTETILTPNFYDINIYTNSTLKLKIFNFSLIDKVIDITMNFLTAYGKSLYTNRYYGYKLVYLNATRADLSTQITTNV